MKRKTRKNWALILVCALIVGILPIGNAPSVLAEGELKNPTSNENGVTTWDCVYFGSYPQSDTNKDGTVDEKDSKEPIKWRVLRVDENDAFLMADQNLDMQKFNESVEDVTWENCTLRTWLNDQFYKEAFTEAEQSAVIKTTVDTAGTSLITTEDNVYLLDIDEVINKYGFVGNSFNASKTREAKNTEYAKQQRGATSETEGYKDNGSWWLRSKRDVNDVSSIYVDHEGKTAFDIVDESFGVRPVLHLNLSSASWKSAGTVSSNGEETEESAAPFPEATTEPTAEPTAEPAAKPTSESTAKPAAGSTSGPTAKATEAASPAVTLSNPKIVKNDKMASGQVVTWDSVYFGSYPQAEVIDTEMSKNYAAIGSDYLKEGDLIVDDALYNDLLTAPNADWDDRGNIMLKGDKYHRILKGDAISGEDGEESYYNWSDSVTYHYFKYEPIKWRVLSAEGNKALLLSDLVLDNQHYQVEKEGIGGVILLSTTWARSSLRSWLNGYDSSFNSSERDYGSRNFIDSAFTDEEQAAVIDTSVTTGANSKYNTSGGDDTTDKIFLLSESEVCGTGAAKKYGFASDAGTYDEARRAKSSTYTKAMGLSWDVASPKYAGNSMWWLRSRGDSQSKFVYVGNWGSSDLRGFGSDYHFGVRPALYVNLSGVSPELIRPAGTVSSGTEEAGPSPSPSAAPAASQNPSVIPSVSPSQNPVSSASPSQNPVSSAKPRQSPVSSAKPSQKPASTAKPSKKPASTVKPSSNNNGSADTQGKVRSTSSPVPAYVTKSAPTVSKVKSLKVKSGKKRLTVTWKAVSGAAGYQLQISTNKNFRGAKKVVIRASRKKYVAKRLKSRKKYFIRIRAYKSYIITNNMKRTVYGKWKKVGRKTK